jgi:predicted RNA-binding Zn-ribbon protein involved in translation (DUF1610 family)
MGPTPTPFPPVHWRKPHSVTLEDGFLVAADFERSPTYPLLEAAREGRALNALFDARADDEVCAFTQNWGFLHYRGDGGRWDRFPLALYHLHRNYLFALARLSTALRARRQNQADIAAALLALKTSRSGREAYLYQRSPSGILEATLTEPERALADQGVPTSVLVQARYETRALSNNGPTKTALSEYAAWTLASELPVQHRLRPLKHSTRTTRHPWSLEEVPIVSSLEDVLRWTIRSRYQVLHHFFCESCGNEAISRRTDTRFCSPQCGTRARVQRFRRESQRG